MKCFGMIVGMVLLLVLPNQGVSQDAAGPSRTSAWEDASAVRLLDPASSMTTPASAAQGIIVEDPRFAQALRASSTTSGSENKWSAQVRCTTKGPIVQGGVLVVSMTLRSVEGPGRVFVAFGTAQPPHVNLLSRYVDVGPQWQEFQFPLRAGQDHAAGEAKVTIGFGAAVQTVDVGRMELLNFQGRRRVWDFVNSSSYRGIEPDAAWRKAALERIEKIRKADVRVEVVDAEGKPVPQSAVNLRMTAHAFRFGSSFHPQVYQFEKSHPDEVRAYEKRFLEYFNVATPEAVMNCKGWENPEIRASLARAMDFLAGHRIPVIGHPLVWQTPKTLPEPLHALIREKDSSAYLARWNAHLEEKVEAMRGRFCEHLVINEFVDTNFLPEAMTDDAIVGWYRLVRQRDPSARLGILEHKMICDGAVEADKTLPWYKSKIEMLLAHQVPLDLIAFQAHDRNHLTEPERLLEILDRFTLPKGGHSVRLVLGTAAAVGSIRLGDRTEAIAVAVAPGATPREQLAAQELIEYRARISGKRLPRREIADGRVSSGVIAVGRLAKDAGLVSQEELDATGRDGYALKVADGRAAVCGGRDLGTLYGAYGLLRRLGVKFYAKDCEIVPAIPKLVLPEGTTKVRPRFDLLGFYSLHRYFGLEPSVKLGRTATTATSAAPATTIRPAIPPTSSCRTRPTARSIPSTSRS